MAGFHGIWIRVAYFTQFIPGEVYLGTRSTGLERRGRVGSMKGEEKWRHCVAGTPQRVSGQRETKSHKGWLWLLSVAGVELQEGGWQ